MTFAGSSQPRVRPHPPRPDGVCRPVGVPLILAVAGYILETEGAEDECDDYEGETGSEE
ncbi:MULTISPECIES: hypothetical protein [unclassified Methanoculleus]|uniref:hypothetical protein n=1 Tax=unclassified Methanoculleus TaxID=2619537 RepID=UPI0025EF8271|nr:MULTISPECIES: hypothetical protein [unclassified Methanoculleus]MDD2787415.1 hypothetical protein [Methanoculleus sp.]